MRYECGIVFPADVGLDSPSRDAATWLSSRFSRSVETRRRYDWLRMVFPRCAFSKLHFGALWEVVARERQRGHCRRKPCNVLSGGYAPDSVRAEGSSIVDKSGEY